MSNQLIDLNNHLFETLNRLNSSELKGDSLKEEMSRAHAVASVAAQIISNANLALKASGMKQMGTQMPEMIEVKKIPNYGAGKIVKA